MIAGMCSRAIGRPVEYLEDRTDNISNCDHHGSDRFYDVELAMMRDGIMRGIKIDVRRRLRRLHPVRRRPPRQRAGPGRRPVHDRQRAVPGAGGADQQEPAGRLPRVRLRGEQLDARADGRQGRTRARPRPGRPSAARTSSADQFPHFIPTGNVYDSGNYERVLDKALELADYDHWRAEQERLREQEGRYIGIGVVSCQERSVFSATEFWFWFDEPGAPVTSTPESVTLSVDATGGVTATLYSCAFWGNSPETMVAQFVAEEFDCDPYDVSVVYHGSRGGLPATGPGGSRTTVMLAGAVEGACGEDQGEGPQRRGAPAGDRPGRPGVGRRRLPGQGRPEAAEVAGRDRGHAAAVQAHLPEEMESGLEASKVYDHPYTTMPSADRKDLGVFYPFMGHACHIPVVEVDIETGEVTFLHYAAVHDCGTLVNPRSLAGHIVGGTAQGIGTALYEEYIYDEDGQLLSSSYLDYLIPSAMEVPELAIGHVETPSPYTAARGQGRRGGRPDDGAGGDQRARSTTPWPRSASASPSCR